MPVLLCMLMAIPMTTTQGAKSWPCVCLQVSLLVVHPPCTQPFPNMGLSKHDDPVFPHFCVLFFGTMVVAVPIQ